MNLGKSFSFKEDKIRIMAFSLVSVSESFVSVRTFNTFLIVSKSIDERVHTSKELIYSKAALFPPLYAEILLRILLTSSICLSLSLYR